MSLVVTNKDFIRQRFEKINRFYGPVGKAPQLDILRMETDLVNGQGVYEFDLKRDILSKVESNLKRNDLFVTLGLGVAVRIEDSEHPYVSVPCFAPHKAILDENSQVVLPGFETDDIQALYNGGLMIQTGQTVNFNNLPLSLFLKNKGTEDAEPKLNHFDLENDLQMMAEEITFSGTQDHKIVVSFPTFAQANYQPAQNLVDDDPETYGTNFKSKLVFIVLGYRVVGGTLPEYRVDSNPYKNCIGG